MTSPRQLDAIDAVERPVDRTTPRHRAPIGPSGLRLPATPIAAIVGAIAPRLPFPPPDRPRTRAELQRDRVERLEQLDRDLVGFLARCAPATWLTVQPALRRILRRARRELRSEERRLTGLEARTPPNPDGRS